MGKSVLHFARYLTCGTRLVYFLFAIVLLIVVLAAYAARRESKVLAALFGLVGTHFWLLF